MNTPSRFPLLPVFLALLVPNMDVLAADAPAASTPTAPAASSVAGDPSNPFFQYIGGTAPNGPNTQNGGGAVRLAKATGHISNYDETRVGNYTLPDPLVLANGQPVKDAETWFKVRRPEIVKLYENEIYGKVPATAPKVTFEVAATNPDALNGTAVYKQIIGHFGSEADSPKMTVSMYLPKNVPGPVPLVLSISFSAAPANPSAALTLTNVDPTVAPAPRGTGAPRGAAAAPAAAAPAATTPAAVTAADASAPAAGGLGATRGGPRGLLGARAGGGGGPGAGEPIADILAHGFGYAIVQYTNIEGDSATTNLNGVRKLALAPGQTAPVADEWGTISAWAWGLSRILDYLETDKDVDARRVALVGHSRLGKTVLWAGASDPRFALVFSSQGGELGSALARRDFGETVDDMAQNFPWQFAGNLQKYPGHWNDMPVDTNMLIALIAPRPLLISGGTGDQWTDPHGEFLGEVAAAPVYQLVGKKDLGTTTWPAPETPLINGDLAYYYHTGPHAITPADWQVFLTFATRELKPTVSAAPASSAARQ